VVAAEQPGKVVEQNEQEAEQTLVETLDRIRQGHVAEKGGEKLQLNKRESFRRGSTVRNVGKKL
jgi:hypothetical protein